MISSKLSGIVIREATRHSDDRGWLVELFRSDELPGHQFPRMGYVSMTKAGSVRGPHEHREQTDLFYFGPESSFRLYLWDNRRGLDTFGVFEQLELQSETGLLVVIPPGIVHAYKNTGQGDGFVMNFPDRLYAGVNRSEPIDEIRHEDNPDSPFVIDDKDV